MTNPLYSQKHGGMGTDSSLDSGSDRDAEKDQAAEAGNDTQDPSWDNSKQNGTTWDKGGAAGGNTTQGLNPW